MATHRTPGTAHVNWLAVALVCVLIATFSAGMAIGRWTAPIPPPVVVTVPVPAAAPTRTPTPARQLINCIVDQECEGT